jgi:hypothetical protein
LVVSNEAEKLIALSALDVERRREPRHSPKALVVFRLSNQDVGTTTDAELVDISASGFRLRYMGLELVPGKEVIVIQPTVTVRAKIMWTAILEGRCESGFLVLHEEP